MAKSKFKYRTRYKKVYRKARSGGGKFKPIIDGFGAGALGQITSGFIGPYGHPVSMLGWGWFRNNNVLITEGARELGIMLTSNFVGNGGTSSGFLGG